LASKQIVSGLLVDRQTSRISFVCSTDGGMDIEESRSQQRKDLSFSVDPATVSRHSGRRVASLLV